MQKMQMMLRWHETMARRATVQELIKAIESAVPRHENLLSVLTCLRFDNSGGGKFFKVPY